MSKPEQILALERLVRIAEHDTGQSTRVRAFLLAWWNAPRDGGFDLTDIWTVDVQIVDDMFAVLALIAARPGIYPDTYIDRARFEALVEINGTALT